MLAEGIFILTVSLSGNYDDLEFVGYFNDCPTAMIYFKENCSKHIAIYHLIMYHAVNLILIVYQVTNHNPVVLLA